MSDDDIGSITVQGLDELDKKLTELGNDLAGKALFSAAMYALTPMVKDAKALAAKAKEPHAMVINTNKRKVEIQPGLLASAIKKRRLPKSEHKGEFSQGAVVGIYVGKGTKQKFYPQYWHFIERGTVKQPATPFIRPAFDRNTSLTVTRFAEKLSERIDHYTE